eukprot:UN07581
MMCDTSCLNKSFFKEYECKLLYSLITKIY